MNQQIVQPGQGRSKNARRRRNLAARLQSAAAVVPYVVNAVSRSNPANPSARTLRNRRRRQRQRANRAGDFLVAQPNRTLYHNLFQAEESATLEQSVHKMLQTQFFPTKGLHRGLARSFTPTALAFVRGSVDIPVAANNTTLSVGLCPTNAAASTFFLSYNSGTTGFPAPFGTGATSSAGPYNANYPGGQMRVVSASLQITPEGALLNQGGAGAMVYIPDGSSYFGTAWTRTAIDNMPILQDWNGAQSIIMHWTPNGDETGFPITGTGGSTITQSILGAYLTGVPNGSSFRVEWQLGVEYVPNATYTSLVSKQTATIHPDTTYWVSAVSQKHWSPLILAYTRDYMQILNSLPSLGGHTDFEAITELGASGMGGSNFDADMSGWDVVPVQNPLVPPQAPVYAGGRSLRGAMSNTGRALLNQAADSVYGYAGNALANYGPSVASYGAGMIASYLSRGVNLGNRIMPGAFRQIGN